ncbi:MAG: hypothetical protein GX131_04825 [candidate division WS1 bacterium]|jgi:predicted small secreted protein|nr:hypothetical protein [candidate division WS1 bacterium]
MMRIEWLLTAVIIGLAVIVVGALAGCPTQEDQTTEDGQGITTDGVVNSIGNTAEGVGESVQEGAESAGNWVGETTENVGGQLGGGDQREEQQETTQ